MTHLPQDLRDALRKPFPPEAISQNGSQTFLSSIKAIYITERLNDVFEIGGWVFSFEIVQQTDYIVVRGKLTVDKYGIEIHQFGGHKMDKIVENSYKSAVTDCLGKCASQIEVGIHVFKGQQSHTNKVVKEAEVAPPSLTDDDVQDAQSSLIDCSNKDQIKELWDSYPKHFQKDAAFKKMFVDYANEIEKLNHNYYDQQEQQDQP